MPLMNCLIRRIRRFCFRLRRRRSHLRLSLLPNLLRNSRRLLQNSPQSLPRCPIPAVRLRMTQAPLRGRLQVR